MSILAIVCDSENLFRHRSGPYSSLRIPNLTVSLNGIDDSAARAPSQLSCEGLRDKEAQSRNGIGYVALHAPGCRADFSG